MNNKLLLSIIMLFGVFFSGYCAQDNFEANFQLPINEVKKIAVDRPFTSKESSQNLGDDYLTKHNILDHNFDKNKVLKVGVGFFIPSVYAAYKLSGTLAMSGYTRGFFSFFSGLVGGFWFKNLYIKKAQETINTLEKNLDKSSTIHNCVVDPAINRDGGNQPMLPGDNWFSKAQLTWDESDKRVLQVRRNGWAPLGDRMALGSNFYQITGNDFYRFDEAKNEREKILDSYWGSWGKLIIGSNNMNIAKNMHTQLCELDSKLVLLNSVKPAKR